MFIFFKINEYLRFQIEIVQNVFTSVALSMDNSLIYRFLSDTKPFITIFYQIIPISITVFIEFSYDSHKLCFCLCDRKSAKLLFLKIRKL